MAYQKKKPYRGKTSNRKASDYKEEKKFTREEKASYNDPSWYIREGQIAKDVASLSFNTALGVRTEISIDNPGGSWDVEGAPYGVPGVLALNFVPAMGFSEDAYSPLNIAAKNLYSWVRHQNSGSKNYDSPDLLLYILAMDSVYTAIQNLQRAYGTARVYSQLNRYVGDGFLSAMGFNAADVRANLAQFRAQINMLIVKASVFAVPNVMSLFRRHAWMARCVYQDAPVDKCQTYIYRPVGLFKYDEYNGAGKLDLELCASQIQSPASGMQYVRPIEWTTAQWFSYVDDMLTRLSSSEDIGIMSGDIIKAYGKENLFTLSYVPEDYTLEVGYSEEVLDQIHNTIFAGAELRTILDPTDEDQLLKVNLTSWGIHQDTSIGDGALVYKPQIFRNRTIALKHVLDMFDKEPSPERVLVATRNMIAGDVSTVTISGREHTYGIIRTLGSDICLNATIIDFWVSGTGNWAPRTRYFFTTDGTATEEIIDDIGDYSAFTKAPLAYLFSTAYADSGFTNIIGQIDNFTVIDRETLSKIHESAILSMLGVPV